jgi:hypothetical protein
LNRRSILFIFFPSSFEAVRVVCMTAAVDRSTLTYRIHPSPVHDPPLTFLPCSTAALAIEKRGGRRVS